MKYLYGMKNRGYSLGCQPRKGLVERKDSDNKDYFDLLVYSRKLTEEEVKSYELELIEELEEKEVKMINLTKKQEELKERTISLANKGFGSIEESDSKATYTAKLERDVKVTDTMNIHENYEISMIVTSDSVLFQLKDKSVRKNCSYKVENLTAKQYMAYQLKLSELENLITQELIEREEAKEEKEEVTALMIIDNTNTQEVKEEVKVAKKERKAKKEVANKNFKALVTIVETGEKKVIEFESLNSRQAIRSLRGQGYKVSNYHCKEADLFNWVIENSEGLDSLDLRAIWKFRKIPETTEEREMLLDKYKTQILNNRARKSERRKAKRAAAKLAATK